MSQRRPVVGNAGFIQRRQNQIGNSRQPPPTKAAQRLPEWFDPSFYFEHYPDIRDYYKRMVPTEMWEHYQSFGLTERRFPSRHSFAAFGTPRPAIPSTAVPNPEPPAEAPTTETPITETPITETPITETPITDTPLAETPTTEAPIQLSSALSKSTSTINTISAAGPSVEEKSLKYSLSTGDMNLNSISQQILPTSSIRVQVPNMTNLDMRAKKMDFTLPSNVQPQLTVLMVTYNRIDCTITCLESLHAVRQEVPLEVLIWDNASSDETVRVLSQIRGIVLNQHTENLHFLRAVNRLAPQARGQYTLLLNNDTQLSPGSLAACLRTFERIPACAIVGGKIILRSTGKLQEAGSVLLSGHPHGYGRNENPSAPEFNFERPVPYCSGCFLMIKSSIFKELDYFDERYAPAYFEETDLSVRVLKQGYLIYYQPECVIYHEEGASASKQYDPNSLMKKNGQLFRDTHKDFLAALPTAVLEARSFLPQNKNKRILWCESELPDPQRGSGYPRMASLLTWLIRDGWHITYYSLWGTPKSASELPLGVEYIGKNVMTLAQLVAQRSSYYGLAIVSRTPTMQAHRHLISRKAFRGQIPVIYDMETLAGLREIEKSKYYKTSRASAEKLLKEDMDYCRAVAGTIVVSKSEQTYVEANGGQNCFQLGHIINVPNELPRYTFENRFGFFFMGYADFEGSPNIDSIEWFCRDIFPIILKSIPNASFSIVGKVMDKVKKEFGSNPAIHFLGQISSQKMNSVIDQHRVFVAPTRFASGLPHKCHAAASAGLPMVCTELLAQQLDWDENVALSAPCEAQAFAAACVKLHSDRALWLGLQSAALDAVRSDCSIEQMDRFRDWLLSFSRVE